MITGIRLCGLSLLIASPLAAQNPLPVAPVPVDAPDASGEDAVQSPAPAAAAPTPAAPATVTPAAAPSATPPPSASPTAPGTGLEAPFSMPAKAKVKVKKGATKGKPGKSGKPKAPKAATKPATLPVPDPNAAAIEPSHHSVGAKALISYFGIGAGLEYIYQPWTNFDFGLTAGSTQVLYEATSGTETRETLTGQNTFVGAFGRFTYSRLLYVGLGLSIKSISGSYAFEGTGVSGGKIEGTYEAQYVVPELFIGSEWNFANNFYVGADWVGLGVPNQSSLTVTAPETLDTTAEFLTGEKADARIEKIIVSQIKFHFMLLRAGYRF